MAESQFAKSMELSNCFGTNFAPNNFNILVVDRDIISLHYISLMLKKASFNVTTSRHGYEALAIIKRKKNNFRLIIADTHTIFDMKDVYYLFLQGINSDIPVILISNTLTKGLDERSLVITKPLNFDQLMALVWQQFQKYYQGINSGVVPTQIGLGGNVILSPEVMAEGISRLSIDEASDQIRLIPNRSVGIRIEEPSNYSSNCVPNKAPSGRIQTHDPQYYPRVCTNYSIKGKEVILINDDEEGEEEAYLNANDNNNNNHNTMAISNNDVQANVLNYPRSHEAKGKDVIIINDDDELRNVTYQQFNPGSGSSEINRGSRDLVTIGDGDEDRELMEREGLSKRKFFSDWEEEEEEGQDKRLKSTSSGLSDYFKFRVMSPLENRYHDNVERTVQEANIPGLMTRSNENYNTRDISESLKESPSMDITKYLFFPHMASNYLDQNYHFLLQSGFKYFPSVTNDFNMSLLQSPNNNEILSPENNNYGVAQNLMTLQIGQESTENNGDVNTNAFNYYCSPKISDSEFGVTRVLDEEDFELNIFSFKRTLEDSYNYAEWLKKNPKGKSTDA